MMMGMKMYQKPKNKFSDESLGHSVDESETDILKAMSSNDASVGASSTPFSLTLLLTDSPSHRRQSLS